VFLPHTWNNGPPWRDLRGKLFRRCNISKALPKERRPCISGLGQGIMEYWNVEDPVFSGVGLKRKFFIFPELIIFTP
jgi:hypothetical protein